MAAEISPSKPDKLTIDMLVGKLEELNHLHARGIITEDEYKSNTRKAGG